MFIQFDKLSYSIRLDREALILGSIFCAEVIKLGVNIAGKES